MKKRLALRIIWVICLALIFLPAAIGCGDDDDEDSRAGIGNYDDWRGSADDDDDNDDNNDTIDDDDDDDNDTTDDDDDDDDDDTTSSALVTVEDPPNGNILARKLIVETDQPCILSGFVTTTTEYGYTRSDPQTSQLGTIHEFWFYGLLEDTSFDYTFYVPDKSAPAVATGSFLTPLLPTNQPVTTRFDTTPTAKYSDWYMVYNHDKGTGVVVVMVYDRHGRIRVYHPSSLGQFNQVMPNGEITGTGHDQIKSMKLNGSEYLVLTVHPNAPYHRATHHKYYLPSIDAASATVIFGRTGPGVECDLVTPTDYAMGDGILEIDGLGNETWRWDVFDFTDQVPVDAMTPRLCNYELWGPDKTDWTHGNAVVPVPDESAYLLSYRNISRVLKINRSTGLIDWQMGADLDFTWIGREPEEQKWFFHQHDPHVLSDDRIILYDNNRFTSEGGGSPAFSRALELQVDYSNMTVEKIWEYKTPYHAAEGNVIRNDNGCTLISTGSKSTVMELPPDGGAGDELLYIIYQGGIVRTEYYPPIWIKSAPPSLPAATD